MTGLTSKGFYAIQIILELSKSYNKKILQIEDIYKSRKIPKGYLIQLLNKLKNLGMIESFRGNKGGYKIAHNPVELTLLEVIEKIEGDMEVFKTYKINDSVKKIFDKSSIELKKNLNITFNELLTEQEKLDKKFMYYI